jgi:3-oxoacyl-(acyl-carrier-protein) synthase
MVANRVSYHLDLRGPSVPVDTACSSTLTATHLAIQSLNAGDCTSAVVGGAQINHRFELLYSMHVSNSLSKGSRNGSNTRLEESPPLMASANHSTLQPMGKSWVCVAMNGN